ncbi:MAG: 4-hydroxythreonine-4-phosphate dehydrogenase PdxA [Deltaproteobacteria bacterium]|nr:4-hydroxythreonine-4-phosphate dehydrogenase PdxA [Deltaproteobacteria bacterium]
MQEIHPVIGITMGDPVGIGPEIILLALSNASIYKICRPLIIGDLQTLESAKRCIDSRLTLNPVTDPYTGKYICGCVDIVNISNLDSQKISWGKPTAITGKAMISYITKAINMAMCKEIGAVVTCPINKAAMKMAGSKFHGHTELLAKQTRSDNYAMMLAGDRLRVVLVTIHSPLKDVPKILSTEKILTTIEMTRKALVERFGIDLPRIAVAALNPHAGESGMFGDEEKRIIGPAIRLAQEKGLDVSGPFPSDSLFYHAAKGLFDAVVCMYHDQGLIPFKMIHFTDGVNTTLGLPIIRTSVDHGTAYDIAGTGKADPGSLVAAIKMAATQAICTSKKV